MTVRVDADDTGGVVVTMYPALDIVISRRYVSLGGTVYEPRGRDRSDWFTICERLRYSGPPLSATPDTLLAVIQREAARRSC